MEQYGSFFEAVCIVVMHLFISFAQKKTYIEASCSYKSYNFNCRCHEKCAR